MRMSALLSRNTSRPGLIGIARVDRNIDRLLRRVCPGDIVVLDVLDLDRIPPMHWWKRRSPPW
ncbi:thiamin pyrophosphokinase catalytic subunit [Mycobacterium tuberculosis]|nr:thiamin pyrophosphokinase catalytic subunit [Mycobacterium tuberculosis]CKV05190.1 thiamin pyrophosphokinase catalytic subunit [Mycobacterium tuberculosis]